ncbi:MAG: hypothetical protein ACJ78M_14360 [Gemmatimonadaceae bacterium]
MIRNRMAAVHRTRNDSAKSSTLGEEPGHKEREQELSGEKSAHHTR